MAEAAGPALVTSVKQTAMSLIYWENQKASAAVLALGLFWFFLIGLLEYSSITVLCYVALFHLVARFLYRGACRILSELNMIEKRPVPTAPASAFVTEEEVLQHLKAATALLNSALHAAYNLAVCDCTSLVLKWIAGLYTVALASKLFGTTGLCFIAFVAIFSAPKIYELKQPQIDRALEQASAQAAQLASQLSTKAGKASRELLGKLPSIPKASDVKAKAL